MTVHVDVRDHVLVEARRDSAGGHGGRALVNLDLGAQRVARAVSATLAGLRRPWHRGHAGLMPRLYQALRDGGPPPVTGDDGRAVVSVLDRVWETLRVTAGERPA